MIFRAKNFPTFFLKVKTGLNEAMTGLGDELEEIKEYKPSGTSENSENEGE